ncbi:MULTISPECIES: hypothetical protein [unclassified Halanaerobium]|uniref:hypothetical protein n=1 Tax=unclassified Halanaerobium TaxID=2641197 RepID=UPI000DF45405|nr:MULTISPECIES: hypothetical protein [unclassified Halanaerobium]RCW50530.1 hypothetical protein DFR78_103115 [Halanaerobium sp. MA284_MarDTE_T2]RCW86013.1 hypothetical protein DER71_10978 [Halanaerobium sp. DL-01]
MKGNNTKTKTYLIYILIAALFAFLIIMIFNFKESYAKKIHFEKKLTKEKIILTKYKEKIKNSKSHNSKNNQNNTPAQSRADYLNEILKLLEDNNLELISYDSDKKLLILNLRGNFNSILRFLHKIEKQKDNLQCKKVKLKKGKNSLYIYLQLEYLELMSDEK